MSYRHALSSGIMVVVGRRPMISSFCCHPHLSVLSYPCSRTVLFPLVAYCLVLFRVYFVFCSVRFPFVVLTVLPYLFPQRLVLFSRYFWFVFLFSYQRALSFFCFEPPSLIRYLFCSPTRSSSFPFLIGSPLRFLLSVLAPFSFTTFHAGDVGPSVYKWCLPLLLLWRFSFRMFWPPTFLLHIFLLHGWFSFLLFWCGALLVFLAAPFFSPF